MKKRNYSLTLLPVNCLSLFFLLTLMISLITTPNSWCMEQPQEIELSQGDIEESSEEREEVSNEEQLDTLIEKMQLAGTQLVEAIKNKKNFQEIQRAYALQKKLSAAAENLIAKLQETPTANLKTLISQFKQAKMKFSGQLKSPLFILNEALQPETVKAILGSTIKSTKEEDIARALEGYYNHQLYNANYAALIYLTLLEDNNTLIQEIVDEDDAIAKQKLEIDKIKNNEERLLEMSILDERKSDLNAKRNLLIPLLRSLETALDYGNKAQSLMKKQSIAVDSRFANDQAQLSQKWSNYYKKIDPESLEAGSAKNEALRQEWARQALKLSETVKKTPERKGSVKDIQKLIKEAKLKESQKK